MIRAVVDTNVFVSGLISRPSGTCSRIVSAWEEKKIFLLVNRSILNEIREVLLRPSIKKYHGMSDQQIGEFCRQIDRFSILVTESKRPPSISVDPNDLKFLDCALAGEAEFLVTGDRELLNLDTVGNTSILSPSEFLQRLIEK